MKIYLVFLVIVLVAVAILAQRLPYLVVGCGAPAAQARNLLLTTWTAQESYRASQDGYADHNGYMGAGSNLHGDKGRYRFFMRSDDKHFAVYAVGMPGTSVAGDVWRIDERRALENIRIGCAL